jgi:adenylate cyclase
MELKQTGEAIAKQYNHVTVLFTDFVNFTGISEQLSPTELVAEVHKNFTAFDAIIEKHGLEKIKTIGDAYLAVCGLPNETLDHAHRVVRAALDIQEYMSKNGNKFQIRVGINSGPVVAGIVGVKKYAYDIWGDTVNTASRMESCSEAGKINISGTTFDLVKNEFTCAYRGKIQAKNKGEVDMYFVHND